MLDNQDFSWDSPVLLALVFALPPLGFVAALLINRRNTRLRSDPALVRSRAARREALARLARISGSSDDSAEFCGELGKVITFYAADKLNQPREGLTIEDLATRLKARKVDAQLADSVCDLVALCDGGRFGGCKPAGRHAEMLQQARELINSLERAMRG